MCSYLSNSETLNNLKHWQQKLLYLMSYNSELIAAFLDVCSQSKLDDYQVRKNKGERLNQDQLVGTLKPLSFST